MTDSAKGLVAVLGAGPIGLMLCACVADAGATFLAPIFDELTAVVCLSGTPMSHIGIVSREYRVPCLMGVALASEPAHDAVVEVDCSSDPGVVRAT